MQNLKMRKLDVNNSKDLGLMSNILEDTFKVAKKQGLTDYDNIKDWLIDLDAEGWEIEDKDLNEMKFLDGVIKAAIGDASLSNSEIAEMKREVIMMSSKERRLSFSSPEDMKVIREVVRPVFEVGVDYELIGYSNIDDWIEELENRGWELYEDKLNTTDTYEELIDYALEDTKLSIEEQEAIGEEVMSRKKRFKRVNRVKNKLPWAGNLVDDKNSLTSKEVEEVLKLWDEQLNNLLFDEVLDLDLETLSNEWKGKSYIDIKLLVKKAGRKAGIEVDDVVQ